MPDATLPAPGLGTYENTDPETCRASVRIALDCGYRHVDTAELYENEAAVGAGLDAADVDREEVFVATKLDSRNLGYDAVRDHALGCCDRLGVDTLDLLYVHWPIRTYDPEGTLAAFDELHDEGLVRHVGLSNFTPDLLADALDRLDAPLFAHQVECHPLLPQEELRATAREDDHYLVAYSPLAKGEVLDVPELVDVAAKHDATPAQVSLAWLDGKENVVPIPKAATPAHIRENYAALDLELDDEDVRRIDAIERRKRVVDFDAAPWN
ncbi:MULTISPECIES: aldo/keto reductase [Salinibaculum]|uniref:aldo/keto reductase n=1 Tax=Salinibaculum TaxID=2732368 RepID=UPI0030CA8C3C